MKVNELKTAMEARFSQTDGRLDGLDARFDRVDARLDRMDARLGQVEVRLDRVEVRLEDIDARLETRIREEGVETRRHIDRVSGHIASPLSALIDIVAASTAEAERRLRPIESERTPLLSAMSEHELRLLVLEGTRRSDR